MTASTVEAGSNMTKSRPSYWFEVTSVSASVGGLHPFAAGATIYWFEDNRGKEVRHDLQECLGATKGEAEDKMRAKVLDWMKRQKDAAGNA